MTKFKVTNPFPREKGFSASAGIIALKPGKAVILADSVAAARAEKLGFKVEKLVEDGTVGAQVAEAAKTKATTEAATTTSEDAEKTTTAATTGATAKAAATTK